MLTRLQTYLFAFKYISVFSASAKDVSTLALVIRPVWHAKGSSLWTLARSHAEGKIPTSNLHICKAYERYILKSMTVDEAASMLAGVSRMPVSRTGTSRMAGLSGDVEESEYDLSNESTGPLAILAKQVIRDAIRTHAERVFLQTVLDEDIREGQDDDNGDSGISEYEMTSIVEAGRSLDEQTTILVDAFEQVCNPTSARFASSSLSDLGESDVKPNDALLASSNDVDTELFALLRSILLYRRIFPSTLLGTSSSACPDSVDPCGAPNAGVSVLLTPMPSPPIMPPR